MIEAPTKPRRDQGCDPACFPAHAQDEQAWARFLEQYTPLLLRWAGRLEFQEADAHDLVQDVLLLLHQKLPQFRHDPRRSFSGWLHTVLINKWRDRRRRPQVQPMDPRSLAGVAHPDPCERLTEGEFQQQVARRAEQFMRAEFADSNWKAFWATNVEGRPAGEVAAELNLSLSAVYQAASRVRRGLRQELAGVVDSCQC